jgi:hypothetical protein
MHSLSNLNSSLIRNFHLIIQKQLSHCEISVYPHRFYPLPSLHVPTYLEHGLHFFSKYSFIQIVK